MTVAAQIISDKKLIFLDVLDTFQFIFLFLNLNSTYDPVGYWMRLALCILHTFMGIISIKLIKVSEVMRDLQRKKTLEMKLL